ncbi:hypothetical protein NSPZN2_40177 [Nitrospira defluvii]|uniref:Uncharacterized protein n=1 Tax=Nitrospira defluvii TaxID=330214 RepID=A0ABM8RSD3_9BACT|nr:hypothetical protein NSPZN2_40177 [Nitrospira defluvii]
MPGNQVKGDIGMYRCQGDHAVLMPLGGGDVYWSVNLTGTVGLFFATVDGDELEWRGL